MTVLDYAVLIIIGFSIVLSIMRGLVKELLALAAWVLAFFVAWLLGGQAAEWMPAEIPGDELRALAGYVATFFVVLLLMSLVSFAVSQMIKSGNGCESTSTRSASPCSQKPSITSLQIVSTESSTFCRARGVNERATMPR